MEGSTSVFKVGQSKVKQWLRCKYAAHLKHVERLEPKRTKRPFAFGKIVHHAIELDANGEDWREALNVDLDTRKMFSAEVEMYGDILTDLDYILTDYFEHWSQKGELKFIKINGKKSEHAFEIELDDGLIFTGIIDGVAKWRTNRALAEHKTFKMRPSEDFRWLNVQSSVYAKAMDILGWKPVDGTLWNYIKSKPPAIPKLLQSGEPSQAKIDSLPSVFKQWCKENGFKAKNYPTLLKSLAENRSEYFFRVFTPISRNVVDNVYEGFVEAAIDMRDNLGKKKHKTIDQHCKWCEFASICRAELTGADADFIKEREFKVSESNQHEDEIAAKLDE